MCLGYNGSRLSMDLMWINFDTMVWCRGTRRYSVINAIYIATCHIDSIFRYICLMRVL